MGENLWLAAKAKANFKPELKMKVVWNTSDNKLCGEMKCSYENCFKISLESHFLLEKYNLCKTFREKQYVDTVYSYIT